MKTFGRIFAALTLGIAPFQVQAWGDQGHAVVALIAGRLLDGPVKQQVEQLLQSDPSGLGPTDLAHEASWADRYRDSSPTRYEQTQAWHYVNLERDAPDLERACQGHARLPPDRPASHGEAGDCVVDKIEQFVAELAGRSASADERRMALQFVLHLVGDLHQPLHAADDHDRGGNDKRVRAVGLEPASLHAYWDSLFVRALGSDAQVLADTLAARITPAQRAQWSRGTPADWAQESFRLADGLAYGRLPRPSRRGLYHLERAYVDAATQAAGQQLSKAGVRLALILNRALAAQGSAESSH
jgi:hypothetical protein